MSFEFEYLMHLLAAASRGFPARKAEQNLRWERLIQLAREQSVEPLVGYVLKKQPELGCPEMLRKELEQRLRQRTLLDFQRRILHFRLLEAMEKAGLTVVLLKGYDAARNFAVPECRISTDVDLWVAPEEEERACTFLAEQGFAVEPRWKNGHHAVCHHPRMGCVELHTLLYDEIVESIWFGKKDGRELIQEPFGRVETPEGSYTCLGDTDNLLFLSLHMIKHFIISGMSLRILMDVALFFAKNRDRVDLERFWNTMKQLRYERLMNCVLWAAVDHFGFEPTDFPGIGTRRPPQTAVVLADLEQGGWLGFNDKEAREDGWYEYNRQMLLRDKKPWQYKAYMLRWRLDAVWTSLSYRQLETECAYLKKRPWLYPAALLGKFFRKLGKFLRYGLTRSIASDEEKMSESGRQRMKLFRELEML